MTAANETDWFSSTMLTHFQVLCHMLLLQLFWYKKNCLFFIRQQFVEAVVEAYKKARADAAVSESKQKKSVPQILEGKVKSKSKTCVILWYQKFLQIIHFSYNSEDLKKPSVYKRLYRPATPADFISMYMYWFSWFGLGYSCVVITWIYMYYECPCICEWPPLGWEEIIKVVVELSWLFPEFAKTSVYGVNEKYLG